MRLPLGTTDFSRTIGGMPDILLQNRYFEADPTNQKDQVGLLSRPCIRMWAQKPTDSPVRLLYSEPGAFSDCLFFISNDQVWRLATDGITWTRIGTIGTGTATVSAAATDSTLFIADGTSLYYYTDDGFARGTLTVSGTISSGETVKIGSTYYKFATDITPGADGSSTSPWLVLIGGTNTDTLQHLFDAIGNTGTPGIDYSLSLTGHTTVTPSSVSATTLAVRAIDTGTGGNSIATTETMANGAWGGTTLSGGGGTTFSTVSTPDSIGIVSVGVIENYTICVCAAGAGKDGRFYWINPGEVTIDPLNFATAERSPDTVHQVAIVGDQIWFPGPNSNEVWYMTGDENVFARVPGRLFDQGIWQGTIVKIKDDVMVTGTDGVVYRILDGTAPQVVSTPGITQRIREAMQRQRNGG